MYCSLADREPLRPQARARPWRSAGTLPDIRMIPADARVRVEHRFWSDCCFGLKRSMCQWLPPRGGPLL